MSPPEKSSKNKNKMKFLYLPVRVVFGSRLQRCCSPISTFAVLFYLAAAVLDWGYSSVVFKKGLDEVEHQRRHQASSSSSSCLDAHPAISSATSSACPQVEKCNISDSSKMKSTGINTRTNYYNYDDENEMNNGNYGSPS